MFTSGARNTLRKAACGAMVALFTVAFLFRGGTVLAAQSNPTRSPALQRAEQQCEAQIEATDRQQGLSVMPSDVQNQAALCADAAEWELQIEQALALIMPSICQGLRQGLVAQNQRGPAGLFMRMWVAAVCGGLAVSHATVGTGTPRSGVQGRTSPSWSTIAAAPSRAWAAIRSDSSLRSVPVFSRPAGAAPTQPRPPSGAHPLTPLAPAGGTGSSGSGNAVTTAQIPSVSVLANTTGKCWFLWWFCDHYALETDNSGNGLHVGAAVVQSGSGDGLLLKLAPTSTFVAMNDTEVAATASSLVQQLEDAGAQVAGPVVCTVADSPLLAIGDIQAVSLIASLPGILSKGVDSFEALGLTGLGLTSAAEASNELVLSPDLPASVAKVLNGVLSGISSWEETHDFWPAMEQHTGMLQTSGGASYAPTYVAGPGQALLIYVGGVSGSAATQTLQIDPALTFVDTGLSTVGLGSAAGGRSRHDGPAGAAESGPQRVWCCVPHCLARLVPD